MADLLGYLGYLSVHHPLMGGHSIELGGQLIDQRTRSFISLGLSCYELLHETLQV